MPKMSDSAPSQRRGKQLLSSGTVREPSSPQHLKPASMKQLARDVHAALLPVLRRYNVPAQQPAEDHLQRHATETSMLKPVKRNPAASPAPCAHIGDCNASWHSPGDLRQGMRELTCTCEEYRAAHNATSPGMGIVGAYLGNSTAVEGGEEPSDTTRRRRTARAASGSHVGGGKERESTSSCETLHKLWTRLLNNAWGGLVSARPTMPNSTSYA